MSTTQSVGKKSSRDQLEVEETLSRLRSSMTEVETLLTSKSAALQEMESALARQRAEWTVRAQEVLRQNEQLRKSLRTAQVDREVIEQRLKALESTCEREQEERIRAESTAKVQAQVLRTQLENEFAEDKKRLQDGSEKEIHRLRTELERTLKNFNRLLGESHAQVERVQGEKSELTRQLSELTTARRAAELEEVRKAEAAIRTVASAEIQRLREADARKAQLFAEKMKENDRQAAQLTSVIDQLRAEKKALFVEADRRLKGANEALLSTRQQYQKLELVLVEQRNELDRLGQLNASLLAAQQVQAEKSQQIVAEQARTIELLKDRKKSEGQDRARASSQLKRKESVQQASEKLAELQQILVQERKQAYDEGTRLIHAMSELKVIETSPPPFEENLTN